MKTQRSEVSEQANARSGGRSAGTNTMSINGYQAVIAFDPDIQMFRGEFVGLNGGADFYAKDVDGLRREGEISLKVFLEACAEDGVEPRKHFSGKFSLRVDPATHEAAAIAAAAHGQSLNQWATEAIRQAALAG
jgi:predicted HicB family RNase H-like nuclease